MWETFFDESDASLSFIRDLINLGAEFCSHSWGSSLFYMGYDIPKVPLPRLVVESMRTINEFAESTLNQLLSS
jgi:hypothetical protein